MSHTPTPPPYNKNQIGYYLMGWTHVYAYVVLDHAILLKIDREEVTDLQHALDAVAHTSENNMSVAGETSRQMTVLRNAYKCGLLDEIDDAYTAMQDALSNRLKAEIAALNARVAEQSQLISDLRTRFAGELHQTPLNSNPPKNNYDVGDMEFEEDYR